MKELVLELITSYENRISTVEELITTAYPAAALSEGIFGDVDKDRERLKTSLQKILAKNCSLRRKDFNRLIDRILSDAERKREEIEEERKRVREKAKEYLDKQKELVTSLREQLVELTQEKSDSGVLEAVISNIKTTCQDTGQQLLTMLRDLQLHLEAFQREHEEINRKLQRLEDRGELLKIEDLRQLEVARTHQDRKTERELRRQEVERLLVHFRQQRNQ